MKEDNEKMTTTTTTMTTTLQQVKTAFSGDAATFELAQRMAKPLCESDIVPDTFRGNMANCICALELSQRLNASPLAVMQNVYLVHGKPSWSSKFLISCINACGKFTPLRYKMTGGKDADNFGCVAWAMDKTGEILESPEVTIRMAKAEGWFTKNGSKWQTMPELMLRYRAATFFANTYCPELTLGMKTEDEVIDVYSENAQKPQKSRFERAELGDTGCDVVEAEKPVEARENADGGKRRKKEMAQTEDAGDEDAERQIVKYIDDAGLAISVDDIRAWCAELHQPYLPRLILDNLPLIAGKVEAWAAKNKNK